MVEKNWNVTLTCIFQRIIVTTPIAFQPGKNVHCHSTRVLRNLFPMQRVEGSSANEARVLALKDWDVFIQTAANVKAYNFVEDSLW